VYEDGGLKDAIPHGLHRNDWIGNYNAKPAGLPDRFGSRRPGAGRKAHIAMRLLRGLMGSHLRLHKPLNKNEPALPNEANGCRQPHV
jgi:hypothetical protein